jgi:SPP1 gp7 family putative phage head morphogenesis protein
LAARKQLLRLSVGPDWIAEMGEKVADEVLQAAASGAEAGEAVGAVTKAIRGLWSGWSKGRAATIARTEVGTMYNTSRYNELPAQGFDKHEWVTSIDEATRSGEHGYDHMSADGEVRRVGDAFSTGLNHPQETGGAPGNVINCRCETIPVVED